VIGPAGAHKKEHCKKLAETFDIKVIETGPLLRAEVLKKTELGAKIQAAFTACEYVPDQVVCDVLKKRIAELE
jgi:adenylate kinase family enzyme